MYVKDGWNWYGSVESSVLMCICRKEVLVCLCRVGGIGMIL